jgi:hypothetical protein
VTGGRRWRICKEQMVIKAVKALRCGIQQYCETQVTRSGVAHERGRVKEGN